MEGVKISPLRKEFADAEGAAALNCAATSVV